MTRRMVRTKTLKVQRGRSIHRGDELVPGKDGAFVKKVHLWGYGLLVEKYWLSKRFWKALWMLSGVWWTATNPLKPTEQYSTLKRALPKGECAQYSFETLSAPLLTTVECFLYLGKVNWSGGWVGTPDCSKLSYERYFDFNSNNQNRGAMISVE